MEFAASLTKPIKPSQLYDTLMNSSVRLQPALRRRRPEKGPSSDWPSAPRILVAEDNVVNQQLALLVLQKLGYRAEVTANGLEALQALEREPYDVVLMDVQMPTMDGLEATRRIHQRWPEGDGRTSSRRPPARVEEREACLAAGMDDYLSKPIRVDELAAALRRCRPHVAPQPRLRRPDPARALRCHQSRSRKGSPWLLGCSIRRRWSASWRPSEMTVVFSRRSSTRS